MTQKHTFTPETARTFEHGESIPHAVLLAQAAQARGCTCEAYVDWFTYNRWQGQGYQVQKDEHGVKLTTFKTVEEKGKNGTTVSRSIPRRTSVFCRCQVKPKREA